MAASQMDDFSQKSFVNGAQDFDRQQAEVIGRTVLEVQALQDGSEDLVVDGQAGRNSVRLFPGLRLLSWLSVKWKEGRSELAGYRG